MRLVSQRPLPGVAPIRTVRATFTAHGSSLYDATFGDTAISILSGLSSLHQQVHQLDRLPFFFKLSRLDIRLSNVTLSDQLFIHDPRFIQ